MWRMLKTLKNSDESSTCIECQKQCLNVAHIPLKNQEKYIQTGYFSFQTKIQENDQVIFDTPRPPYNV